MASGFGYHGNRSRCFTFWQEFRKCYAMADRPEQCTLQKDDYFECLHHTKERARAKDIKTQELKLIEQKKKQDELSRKLTDSANKSNVTRLDIIKDSDKQQESSN
jgi:NADH dehydrogenase (ubiquinone) Fe-S protein 5